MLVQAVILLKLMRLQVDLTDNIFDAKFIRCKMFQINLIQELHGWPRT